MYSFKTGQKTLFDVEMQVAPDKLERLRASWAASFQKHALPLLVEAEPLFEQYYHQQLGAPSKPGAVMLGLLILKETFDLTDAETLERLDYDLAWHYALDIAPTDTYVCPKTLYNFRKHIQTRDDAANVLGCLTDRILKAWSIKTSHHRLDSTHILSNMRVLSRLCLFVKTIEQFLHQLERKAPGLVAKLPKRFHENYLERKGYFADAKSSEAPRRLKQCAKDLWYLIDQFRDNDEIAGLKAYRLMIRLFKDQCVVCERGSDEHGDPIFVPEGLADSPFAQVEPDGQCEVNLKANEELQSTSLQNPSDPDATYSAHKGKGYQAQLGETCHPDNPFQVIDYVKVEGAHNCDQNTVQPFHEELIARGHTPQTTYVDSAYVSGKNIVNTRGQGVELKGPMSGETPSRLTFGDFQFNDERTEIISCPAGHAPVRHAPVRHKSSQIERAMNAFFSKSVCEVCPLAAQCPTRVDRGCFVSFTQTDVAIGQRRCEQETAEFKQEYKIRSGIEATNSHLKNKRGLHRLRVRGSPAVKQATIFKVLAENISRMVNHALHVIKKTVNTPVAA
jgi:hypothetical protein